MTKNKSLTSTWAQPSYLYHRQDDPHLGFAGSRCC